MQTTFSTLTYPKIVFLFFLSSFTAQLHSSEFSLEAANKEVTMVRQKITNRFEVKIAQKQKELELCINSIKKEALYHELETAITALHKEPVYEFYALIFEAHEFIKELERYNASIIRTELLKKINELLEYLKTDETFTSLRSTLKKQRVALIELFEEKDLILSIENILKYQNKDLTDLLAKQLKKVHLLTSYQHAQEVQKKYLATPSITKFFTCIEKIQNLLVQQEVALLKSKEYQKATRTYELLLFRSPAHASLTTSPQEPELLKKQLLKAQWSVFAIPLENIL